MLNTYEALVEWIEKNVPKKELGHPTVREAAIWFACIREAEFVHEACSLKDLADMFREGYPALNTPERVTELLQEQFFDGVEDEAAQEGLVRVLNRHFGLPAGKWTA